MIHQLDCKNCGAKLNIGDDTDIFSCGYCGSQQQVDRAGGIIQLRKIENTINAIRSGTDKTAAELAIVRLERELPTAEREYMEFLSTKPSPPQGPQMSVIELLLFITLYPIGAIIFSAGIGARSLEHLLIAVAMFIALGYCQYHQEKKRSKTKQIELERYRTEVYAPYESELRLRTAKLDAIRKKLQDQREIANS